MTQQEIIVPRELRVSHSEAESYNMCERRHYYGYGMRLTRKGSSSIALDKGTLGHTVLANYFTAVMHLGWNSVEFRDISLPEIMHALQNGTSPDITSPLVRIFSAFENTNPFKDKYDVLAVEKSYSLKMSDDFYFAPFIIDLIVRDRSTGKVYIVDHKFMKDFIKPWDMDIMPQLPKYIGGLRALGYPVDGGFYHVLRTGYGAKALDSDIVALTSFDPSDARIQNTFKDHIRVASRIKYLRGLDLVEWEDSVSRVANKMVCGHCPFKEICVADLNGHASRLLIGTSYVVKEENADLIMTVDSPAEIEA